MGSGEIRFVFEEEAVVEIKEKENASAQPGE